MKNFSSLVKKSTKVRIGLIILASLIFLAITLLFIGRIPICDCGYVKLWHGVTLSSQNSQHIFDPYTFTHVLHGFLFFFLIWIFFRKLKPEYRLYIALGVEILWEIIENTSFIINRYRSQTIDLGYTGDSIVNSIADVIAMLIGYFIVHKLPVWASILLFILIEVILMIFIRDSLMLNIIMLTIPIEAIRVWQSGG